MRLGDEPGPELKKLKDEANRVYRIIMYGARELHSRQSLGPLDAIVMLNVFNYVAPIIVKNIVKTWKANGVSLDVRKKGVKTILLAVQDVKGKIEFILRIPTYNMFDGQRVYLGEDLDDLNSIIRLLQNEQEELESEVVTRKRGPDTSGDQSPKRKKEEPKEEAF